MFCIERNQAGFDYCSLIFEKKKWVIAITFFAGNLWSGDCCIADSCGYSGGGSGDGSYCYGGGDEGDGIICGGGGGG